MLGQLAALTVALVLLAAVPASAAVPAQDAGAAAGPLNHVVVGNSLGCQAQHTGDTTFEFFPSAAAPGDCGTFLFAAGTLFTPDFSNHDTTSTFALGARTAFTPVSQTGVTGSGSTADPFKIVTVVNAGATGLRVTETDTYVTGQESYRTDVQVTNTGGAPQSAILYRAADCYLQDSDRGFGFTGPDNAVGCAAQANNSPAGRIIEWVPITGGNNFSEDIYSTVWGQIAAHTAFPNTCAQCGTKQDNGAGISWSFNLAGAASETRSHFTVFSPTGVAGPPGPPPAPAPTPTPTPTPTGGLGITPTTPTTGTGSSGTTAAGPTVGPKGNPLGLPSARKCIDKRKFTFRLRRPQGRVVDVQVFINSVPTGRKRAANIKTLTIAKLPQKGSFKVRIEALSANGTKLISQRTYKRCSKSKVKGRKVRPKR